MNALELTCRDEKRRHGVRKADLNGLDYLEVSDDQLKLTVYFLGKAPGKLKKEEVRIDGGQRVRNIRVVDLRIHRAKDPDLDDCMVITVDRPGDFSTYTLCLVEVDKHDQPIVDRKPHRRPRYRPLRGFDPRYSCLEFSFKANCPTDLDCKPQEICPPPERFEPEINYLAKDYASFRRLILDRLALIMPDWQERHIPDLGVALVEILAYVGDHLSYYQDAVATEAHLGTARQRISVRRHARLMDYRMHEGCNARTWVCIKTSQDLADPHLKAKDVFFITDCDQIQAGESPLTLEDLRNIPASRFEVFEPLVGKPEEPIQIYKAHNEIHFHTWGDKECCLPIGTTKATLRDAWVTPQALESGKDKPYEQAAEEQDQERKPAEPYEEVGRRRRRKRGPPAPTPEMSERERKLHLKVGDVLIFEEVIGPKTGTSADADPIHRHAMRLTRAHPDVDPLFVQPIVEIEWAEEDELPFPLCISAIGPAPECAPLENISVVRGNVILVDHGRRIPEEEREPLGSVPVETMEERCGDKCNPPEIGIEPGAFRPRLEEGPITFSQPLPSNDAPASAQLAQDPSQALPQVELFSTPAPSGCDEPKWIVRPDLLNSRGGDCDFVVEIDNDGRAHLRFGDGELGRKPEFRMEFTATYRVGNGPSGNVGAGAISHLVLRRTKLNDVKLHPRNPLPARGGTVAERLADVKLFAPHAFRTELQRAITADDYGELVIRDFKDKVQRAAAALRWTGSWYEVLVAIDPLDQIETDKGLLDAIRGYLHRYRRIGHDLMVAPASYVPLDIQMTVCVLPDYLRGHVKAALLDVFSNRTLPNGGRGFFHPDNLGFGEGVFLSKLIAAAQAVPGVESVTIDTFQRLDEESQQAIRDGVLALGPLEIARLDNDPSFPENGQLRLHVQGGR